MKIIHIPFVILISTFLFISANNAKAGHGFGNGGDITSLVFIEKGYEILNYLENTSLEDDALLELSTAEFRQALTDTRVVMVREQLVDLFGTPVDALTTDDDPINPGKPLIKVLRRSFLALLLHGNKRVIYKFVFHEYLRVMGINDDNYKLSSILVHSGIDTWQDVQNATKPFDEKRRRANLQPNMQRVAIDCKQFDHGLLFNKTTDKLRLSYGCTTEDGETSLTVSYLSGKKRHLKIYQDVGFNTFSQCELFASPRAGIFGMDYNEIAISSFCFTDSDQKVGMTIITIAPEGNAGQ